MVNGLMLGMSQHQVIRWRIGHKRMNGMKRSIASAASITCCLLSSLLLSCTEGPSKKLVDRYRLERFSESGSYYVIDARNHSSGGGVFDGVVDEIGWNDDWILARVRRLYHGDSNGWYVLNVRTREVKGALLPSDIKKDPVLAKLQTRPCTEIIPGR